MSNLKGLLASLVIALATVTTSVNAQASNGSFPIKPDPQLTPGSLCERPTTRRYSERIAYCERNVESELKWEIIHDYNDLGYRIQPSQRGQFKIDHYIPLCMGGSNEADNLWPQHASIYKYTDELEGLLCAKMKDGRLKQRDAIKLIMEAKNDLQQVRRIISYANGL